MAPRPPPSVRGSDCRSSSWNLAATTTTKRPSRRSSKSKLGGATAPTWPRKDFEGNVNKAITAGLIDIRDRVTKTSVDEIISQLPSELRDRLAIEFSSAIDIASQKLNEQIRHTPFGKELLEGELARQLEKLFAKHLDLLVELLSAHERIMNEALDEFLRNRELSRYGDRDEAKRFKLEFFKYYDEMRRKYESAPWFPHRARFMRF